MTSEERKRLKELVSEKQKERYRMERGIARREQARETRMKTMERMRRHRDALPPEQVEALQVEAKERMRRHRVR